MGTADGVPRAIHALRALHRQAPRPVALPHPGGGRRVSARALLPDDGRDVCALREVDPPHAGTLRPEISEERRRQRCRAPGCDPREGARHAAGDDPRGHAIERRAVRNWAGSGSAPSQDARESAGGGDGLRRRDARGAAQGDPGVSHACRRPGPRRPVERISGRRPVRYGGHRKLAARRDRGRGARRSRTNRLRPGWRGQDRRVSALCRVGSPRRSVAVDRAA